MNANKRTAVLALDLFLWANNRILLLDDESEMYELATNTASYRARGISHEACLAGIIHTLKVNTVNVNKIRWHRRLRQSSAEMRRWVRTHNLNRAT
jgi:prophage maintenance system killer protein